MIAALAVLRCGLPVARAVDDTWNYAVRVTADVSANPFAIKLSWPIDTEADATYQPSYTVYRRANDSADWGPGTALPAGQTFFVDANVVIGTAYEYQIVGRFRHPRFPELDHDAYGYILAGSNVPLADNRGKVILVVEDRVLSALGDRVARFQGDLVGDGWTVAQVAVNAADAPATVRQRIQAEDNSGKAEALVLLGHVPVIKSGQTAPDGHDPRPLPCDAYYGDVDGQWTETNGDGVLDQDTLPSDVELETGRIDFSGLQDLGTGLDDLELTARYLDKDHAFREGQLRFLPRALISDRIGIDLGRAPAAAGYRAFTAMFGADEVIRADPEDNVPDDQRWSSMLANDSYAWTFGSGGGQVDSIASLGIHGDYKTATSTDLAASSQAGFYLLFGSFFIDWSQPDNLLRSALASPNGGLGAAWSGRPSFIFHRLALGETIGAGVRLTQNNDGFVFSPDNAFRRGIHIAWLGDPTLRLHFVAPPTAVTGTRTAAGVALSWQPSADAVKVAMSYEVYRSATKGGPFQRLTSTPIATTAFADSAGASGATYLVKAVALQATASGTYVDSSEGVTWTDDSGATIAPPPQSTGATPSGDSGGSVTSSSTPVTHPVSGPIPARPVMVAPPINVKGLNGAVGGPLMDGPFAH